jgi:hypothetical protein
MTRQSLAEFAEAITSSASTILDDPRVDTPQLVAEGSRYLSRLIAGGAVVAMESWDAAYPRLVKMVSPTIQYRLPAADCCYLYAAVHGDHTYRITGTIGTSRLAQRTAAERATVRRCDGVQYVAPGTGEGALVRTLNRRCVAERGDRHDRPVVGEQDPVAVCLRQLPP